MNIRKALLVFFAIAMMVALPLWGGGEPEDMDMMDEEMEGEMGDEMGDENGESAPFDFPPPTMTELADGVYVYFGFFTASLVVISDDDVLITDSANLPRAQSLQEEIAKLTSTPVTMIAMTHEHYDHVGGSSVFGDATVICHVNCQPIFDLAPPDIDVPRVDITFEDYKEIMVGDKVVELHYLAPGDGDATTVIYMPEEQIVLTADMYESRELTHENFIDDKHFIGVREILNTISEWDIKHAITTHTPGTDVANLREGTAYYNDLYDLVSVAFQEAVAVGGPFSVYGLVDTLPPQLQLEQYKDWTNYDSSFLRHVERMLLAYFHGD